MSVVAFRTIPLTLSTILCTRHYCSALSSIANSAPREAGFSHPLFSIINFTILAATIMSTALHIEQALDGFIVGRIAACCASAAGRLSYTPDCVCVCAWTKRSTWPPTTAPTQSGQSTCIRTQRYFVVVSMIY